MLVRAAEVWADTPAITSPLLKLFSELVHNKSGRISFPVSSPDGYLLFRETSKLLVAYGQRLVRHTPADPKVWLPHLHSISKVKAPASVVMGLVR
mgnify:CR=1 FL=1